MYKLVNKSIIRSIPRLHVAVFFINILRPAGLFSLEDAFVSEVHIVSFFRTEVIILNCIRVVICSLFSDAASSSGYIYLSVYLWLYSPLLVLDRFSVSWSFTQSVGLLGQWISPSQGSYLHTGQHKHRTRVNAHTDIHALSGIRAHDLSAWAGEDSSFLRPGGHCHRSSGYIVIRC
jgi:hypothetical protein